ncbi:hypothetical protein AB0H36_15760, partial [Kribbella sp. NPDC050820]|uniref:hypothetical protein n=1 Tax=Kribbella sp. NPDC050820 TaxID=3155408 RepID=UPI0034003ED7
MLCSAGACGDAALAAGASKDGAAGVSAGAAGAGSCRGPGLGPGRGPGLAGAQESAVRRVTDKHRAASMC